MNSLVGQVVNALALVGAVGVLAVFVRYVWGKHRTREDEAEAAISAQMRQDIDDRAQTEREAIQDAANRTDAPNALAEIGNKRREF